MGFTEEATEEHDLYVPGWRWKFSCKYSHRTISLSHLLSDGENYSALFLADIPASQLHALCFLFPMCTNPHGCCPQRWQLAARTAPAAVNLSGLQVPCLKWA